MKRVDLKYLESLHQKEEQLTNRIAKREKEQERVNALFLEHIRKELDLLVTEKQRMNARNEQFLKEVKNYAKEFTKVLPQLMEAEDKLKKAKTYYAAFLQKQIK